MRETLVPRHWIMATLLFLVLTACSATDIFDTGYSAESTIGQELIDLKKAYDAGIITEGEYERARADILWRYDD